MGRVLLLSRAGGVPEGNPALFAKALAEVSQLSGSEAMLAMYDLYDASKVLTAPIAAPLNDDADPAGFLQLCAESGILAVIEGEAGEARRPPAGPVSIRAAVPADLGLIHAFILALADYERLSHEVRANREALGRYLFGERPVAEVLIAEVEEEPVGFALFFHNFSTFEGRPGLYLEDLFVAPAARGKGAGRALLSRLANIALERGCARMEWAVLDWNAPAIAFYRALGARPMDEWTVNRVDGAALARLAEG
jgi:GNAT superfamily N-acetyltransferase